MSFESYKLLHLAAIFVFLSGASVLLLAQPSARLWKMVTGISSLLILIFGMGALAKLQGGGIPVWAQAKIVIWLVVTGLGHMVAKRFPARAMQAYWVTILLAVTAAALAIYKPV